MQINVYSSDGRNEGKYPIVITGTTKYYNSLLSTISQLIELQVICKPKLLSPKDKKFTEIAFIGGTSIKTVSFKQFDVTPTCMTQA